jgi:hypothetical protein
MWADVWVKTTTCEQPTDTSAGSSREQALTLRECLLHSLQRGLQYSRAGWVNTVKGGAHQKGPRAEQNSSAEQIIAVEGKAYQQGQGAEQNTEEQTETWSTSTSRSVKVTAA